MKIGLQRVEDVGTSNNLQKIVSSLGETAWGGTNLDTSSSTGIPVINSGVWSVSSNAMETPEGGRAVKLINRTGHISVKGEIVIASTSTDMEVTLAPTSTEMPIGCIYNAGVAEGSYVWVVVSGIAEVLYDASATTRGNWVQTSALTAGRADGSSGSSPGVAHFREIGHAITSASGNALGKIIMHLN